MSDDKPEMIILDSDDPDFKKKFLEAIGATDGEKIRFVTPQFKREDKALDIPRMPAPEEFASKSANELRAMGMLPWDDPDAAGMVLWLFPGEWFMQIPQGLLVTDINGETETFDPATADDDIRFGCLAYGVMLPVSGKRT